MRATPLSKPVASFATPSGTVVVGKREAIPAELQRFAVSAPFAIRAALSAVLASPRDAARLRQLARQLGGLALDRRLLEEIMQEAVGLAPRLLVLDLNDRQFLLTSARATAGRGGAAKPSGAATEYLGALGVDAGLVNDGGQPPSEDTNFERVIVGAFKLVPGQAQEQLSVLLEPKTLWMINAAMVTWAGAHFIGVGWAADAFMVCIGIYFIGFEIFEVGKCVARAISLTTKAKGDADLDQASKELARAITIVGVDAFMALVTKTIAKRGGGPRKMGAMDEAPAPVKAADEAPAAKPKPQPRPTLNKVYAEEDLGALATERRGTVYRGDRRPIEDVFDEGFAPPKDWAPQEGARAQISLEEHITGKAGSSSQWVSTSNSMDVAQNPWYTGMSGHVYVIEKPGGVDVNKIFGELSPKPGEMEVAFTNGIESRYIKGAHEVIKDFKTGERALGEFIPNPNYNP